MTYRLENNTQQFINRIQNSPPIYTLEPQQARIVLNDLQQINDNITNDNIINKDINKYVNKDINIDVDVKYQNEKISMRIIKPNNNNDNNYLIGNYQSPEANYEKIIKQCFLGLSYISKYGLKYNLNTNKIGVIGDSVGGNLATVMALLAREKNISLQCQAL